MREPYFCDLDGSNCRPFSELSVAELRLIAEGDVQPLPFPDHDPDQDTDLVVRYAAILLREKAL